MRRRQSSVSVIVCAVCTVFYVQHHRIPKTVLFSAVVTVDQYKEVIYEEFTGTTFNDLELPITQAVF